MDQANPKCANNITSNLILLKSQPKPNKIRETHITSVLLIYCVLLSTPVIIFSVVLLYAMLIRVRRG